MARGTCSVAVVLGVLCALLVADTAAAQQNYWWSKTVQLGRSLSQVNVFSAPTAPVARLDDTGEVADVWVTSDVQASTIGSLPPGSIGVEAVAHGEILHQLDAHVLGWNFLQDLLCRVWGHGPGGWSCFAGNWDGADAQAVLDSDTGQGSTTARAFVQIAWVSTRTGPFQPFNRNLVISMTFGPPGSPASLTITVINLHVTAYGTDGWGQAFFKTSATPLNSDIGSFAIGGSEFTGPVNCGDPARVFATTRNPQDSYRPIIRATEGHSQTDGGPVNYQAAGTFDGVVTVQADTPAP